jgi:S-adenosylmethionine:tRNA ribosyltransferase-isomerase
MLTSDFDFELPQELIAQSPAAERDQSRLLVLYRDSERIEHRRFRDLVEYLTPGDLLVLNNSRVMPARLAGKNRRTGGEFEILLLETQARNDWWCMLRPGKRARVGTEIALQDRHGNASPVHAVVTAKNEEGHCRLQFYGTDDITAQLNAMGRVPLPPYIRRIDPTEAESETDRDRYQTVYARETGSVAAPTAGLHFTEALLGEIRSRGIGVVEVTLHVGLGTFAPVKTEVVADHPMHAEHYFLSEEAVRAVVETRRRGGSVVAVGTTSVRVLESAAAEHDGRLTAGEGSTNLFIYPPYKFQIVDALLTNFHVPRSTLLMLVSAFAAPDDTHGRERILSAYAEAVRERYRFFSYGDAMLLL